MGYHANIQPQQDDGVASLLQGSNVSRTHKQKDGLTVPNAKQEKLCGTFSLDPPEHAYLPYSPCPQ